MIFAVFQRPLLYKYRPTITEGLSIEDFKLGEQFGRDVQIETEDGHLLQGWLINARNRLGLAPAR